MKTLLHVLVGLLVLRLTRGEPTSLADDPNIRIREMMISGLTWPTAIKFAPAADGRVFIIEKAGKLKVLDSISDKTPTLVFDVSPNTFSAWDHGLLGLAVHPSFPSPPFVYILYTRDVGDTMLDLCTDKCAANGRLSRLNITSTNTVTGGEQILLEGFWCSEYGSHTAGDLVFGADGYLYITYGEGANFNGVDVGQLTNACGDPTNEGGALRSQDIRTSGDPITYDGALLRVDPVTGAAAPTNVLETATRTPPFTADEKRIVAHGMRNPFRMTARPGTNPAEIWIADVGWNAWEEINVVKNPTTELPNFGWPCYEGNNSHSGYSAQNKPLCQQLYLNNSAPSTYTPPFFTYAHGRYGNCSTVKGNAITSIAVYNGTLFPPKYKGALIFGDYTVGCVWAMLAGADGNPNRTNIQPLISSLGPVYITMGPNNETLFLLDAWTQKVFKLEYGPPSPPAPPAPPAPPSPPLPPCPAGGAQIFYPLATTKWQVGQTVLFNGTYLDTPFTKWTLVLYHCSASWPGLGVGNDDAYCHVHPQSEWEGITKGSFIAPDHEYPAFLRLCYQIGAEDCQSCVNFAPMTVVSTFRSLPAGLKLAVGSTERVTPFTHTSMAGSAVTITAPSPQILRGSRYSFFSWSNWGPRSQQIVTATARTYSATFYRNR
eukprot:jgi/Mesvir1/27387/Mv07191-RA.1